MKKKNIFGCIAFMAIVLLAAFHVNMQDEKPGLNDISLDNVEALSQEIVKPNCINMRGFCANPTAETDQLAFK